MKNIQITKDNLIDLGFIDINPYLSLKINKDIFLQFHYKERDDDYITMCVSNDDFEDALHYNLKHIKTIEQVKSLYYIMTNKIIPKEEQKQHLIDMMRNDEELGLYDETEHLLSTQANKERLLEDVKEETQRMYSEEEVIDLLQEMNDYPTIFEGRIDIKEWFEQLKKK